MFSQSEVILMYWYMKINNEKYLLDYR